MNPVHACILFKKLLLAVLINNRTDYIETLLDLNISLSDENINNLYKVSHSLGELFHCTVEV